MRLVDENVVRRATVISLTGADYVALFTDLSCANVAGGAVYDAVIARSAQLGGADLLVTLNVSDFERVRGGFTGRVVSPQVDAPPNGIPTSN